MSDAKSRFFELAKRPLKQSTVVVEGQEFHVRELSERDAAEMELKMQDKKTGKFDLTRHRRLMVSYCLVDEAGNRFIDDPEELADFPKSIIGKIYEVAQELSSYNPGEVESLIKKSDEATG